MSGYQRDPFKARRRKLREARATELAAQGLSTRTIATRLGCKCNSVRDLLGRLGWHWEGEPLNGRWVRSPD